MAQRKAIAICVLVLSKSLLFFTFYLMTLGLFPELFNKGYHRFKIGMGCFERLNK